MSSLQEPGKIGAATAGHPEADPDWVPDNQCNTNQLNMNICAERHLKTAEADMDNLLGRLLERVKGTESESLLRQSQDSWLKSREADCRYATSGLTPDGSMIGQILNDCRTSHIRGRIKQPEEFQACRSNVYADHSRGAGAEGSGESLVLAERSSITNHGDEGAGEPQAALTVMTLAQSWSETGAISDGMTLDRGYLGPQSEGDQIHSPGEANLWIPMNCAPWHAMVVGQ
jgi:uncharacterized protein YecT (DUF1311 family)